MQKVMSRAPRALRESKFAKFGLLELHGKSFPWLVMNVHAAMY